MRSKRGINTKSNNQESVAMTIVPKSNLRQNPLIFKGKKARKTYAGIVKRGNNTIFVTNNIQVNIAFIWQRGSDHPRKPGQGVELQRPVV
jgi:hypothetical protein